MNYIEDVFERDVALTIKERAFTTSFQRRKQLDEKLRELELKYRDLTGKMDFKEHYGISN